MNKLEFQYNDGNKNLMFENITFIVKENNNGNEFSAFLEKAFSGVNKEVLLNGQPIIKGQFSVYSLSRKSELLDELKLTAKSLLGAGIKRIINEMNEHTKNLYISKFNSLFDEMINDNLSTIALFDKEFNSEHFLEVKVSELFDIIKDNISFTNQSTMSPSLSKTLFINTLLEINTDNAKIIILDDFDNDLDLSQKLQIIENCQKKDIVVYILTNDSNLINLVYKKFNVYLQKHNFISVDKLLNNFNENQYIKYCDKNSVYFDEDEFKIVEIDYEKYYNYYFILFISVSNIDLLVKQYNNNDLLSSDIKSTLNQFCTYLKQIE